MLELMNLIAKGKKPSFTGEEVQKLLASDGAAYDYFGRYAAISSDNSVIVVGAYGDDDKGSNSGSAYVFTKQLDGSYAQSQKLTASDGSTTDCFGCSVAISGDSSVLVIGAYFDDDKGAESGSVYVFTKQLDGSYAQNQKLTAIDGTAQDYFGGSVAISDDSSVIVVGAYHDDDKGIDSGSAYVFNKQSNGAYVQSHKLLADDGAAGDVFGISVAINSDGSVIVVGAYYDDDKGNNSGSVYVFTRHLDGSYVQSQKLLASDGASDDRFGYSVAISGGGSVIVVGAYLDSDMGSSSGSVYVFTKQSNGEYAQSQKLTANDGAALDYFGATVTVNSDGSVIAVGAYRDGDNGSNSGSAYVFTKQSNGEYAQSQKLLAPDGEANDYFGSLVSIDGNGSVIVVGAYLDSDKGSASGSAYVFK